MRLYKETNADLCKKYIVDGMNTVVEQDGIGSLRYKYVYANGMLLARIDTSGNKYYYHHDGLGSITGISNSTPEVTTAMLFDDFGNWLYWDSNWDYYTYIGQEYDWPLTDAYNLRAREYYPEYGRFMQEDPIGNNGGSLNWFLYTANNPVNWTDPTGEKVYYCWRKDFMHAFIGITHGNLKLAWGFYPKGAPLTGILTGLTGGSWPGEIRNDKSLFNTQISDCIQITSDDCHDKKVIETIYKLDALNPDYQLKNFNCYHWAQKVLIMAF